MSNELLNALDLLEKEKGLSKEVLIEAIESALTTAYKKHFESSQNIRAVLNPEDGEISIYVRKKVAVNGDDDLGHISIDDARQIDVNYEEDDCVETKVETPKQFMRIAAQTAKQIMMQKIKEAERENIYRNFYEKKDELITGIVNKIDKSNIIIGVGRAEAVLPGSEQIAGERYRIGDHIKLYVVDVKDSPKGGPQIVVSRTHPGLIRRLFELEVPEIKNGVVEIMSVAREAGSRTKVAVYANNPGIDPIGSCVGQRGARVQSIVNELGNEKIDIINWSADPVEYISNSLSPANVVRVEVFPEEKAAKVVVPDDNLSLAIGKEGQNARLAARLTGWKIDIKREGQYAEEMASQIFMSPDEINEQNNEEVSDIEEQ